MRKRLVYGGIAFIWIVQAVYVTTMGILSTEIIRGSCVPWGSYKSFAAEKTITSFIFIVALVLPLTLMVFCYSKIVYKLKHTVTVYDPDCSRWDGMGRYGIPVVCRYIYLTAVKNHKRRGSSLACSKEYRHFFTSNCIPVCCNGPPPSTVIFQLRTSFQ